MAVVRRTTGDRFTTGVVGSGLFWSPPAGRGRTSVSGRRGLAAVSWTTHKHSFVLVPSFSTALNTLDLFLVAYIVCRLVGKILCVFYVFTYVAIFISQGKYIVSFGQGSSLLWTHTLRPYYSRPIALTQKGRSLVNDVCKCVHD